MICFPLVTINKNVPTKVCLICEYSQCSGEIITTIYADHGGQLWRVTDWSGDKPHKVDPEDIACTIRVTLPDICGNFTPLDLYREIVHWFDPNPTNALSKQESSRWSNSK